MLKRSSVFWKVWHRNWLITLLASIGAILGGLAFVAVVQSLGRGQKKKGP